MTFHRNDVRLPYPESTPSGGFIMKSQHLLTFVACVFLFGCKSDSTAPVDSDQPPSVESFLSRLVAAREFKLIFTIKDPDSPLDSVSISFGDATPSRVLRAWGQTRTDSIFYTYTSEGQYAALLTVFSKGKTGSKNTTVSAGDLPPVIMLSSLSGSEGSLKRIAKAGLAHDPENDPFTLEVSSQSAGFLARFVGDSLEYGCTDPDVNGTFSLLLRATDNRSRVVEKTVPVSIAARDDISGRVHDIMEGQYVVAAHPELVMQGPFTGWVKIDGQTYAVDANGNFASAKLVPGTHTIERFLTNGIDSSFIASDDVAAGDRTFDAFVHTNAGTRLTLDALRQFYFEANLRARGNRLNGFDFSNAQSQRYYLAGKDTAIAGLVLRRLTPNQQDGAEYTIVNDWFVLLPPDKRPQIYKAPQGESLPYINENGFWRPPIGLGGIFIDNNSGSNGTFSVFYDPAGFIAQRCHITLRNNGSNSPPYYGFNRSTINQEAGSWLCSPTGNVTDSRLGGKTVFHEFAPTYTPTEADMKLLYMVLKVPLGTYIDDQWKLPN